MSQRSPTPPDTKEYVTAHKGVNLGGWLVLEKWLTPSLFNSSDAIDEHGLVGSQQSHKMIEHHYKTFITTKDIIWLKDSGVTHLRIPVGYWIFGDQPPYLPSITHLDRLFKLANTQGLHILLSIHGAPGSQNGKHHSGKSGEVSWSPQRHELESFAKRLVSRYRNERSFWGIGVLNEPHASKRNTWQLYRYYRSIIPWIRLNAPSLHIYIDGTFRPTLWALTARILRAGVDMHLYHGFGGADDKIAYQRLKKSTIFLKKIRLITPFIIGEWSGVISKRPSPERSADYIKRQEHSYSLSDAYFYWTYKTESGGNWSFRDIYQ